MRRRVCTKIFSQYFPQFKAENLYYGLPDIPEKKDDEDFFRKEFIVFGILGTWEERKNQLGFVKSVILVPENLRKKARFVILGNSSLYPDYALKVKNEASGYAEIMLLSELPHSKLMDELAQMDVIVSFSNDDPMPVVLTEAFIHSKAIITTDQTGTASLIESGVNGFVVPSEDSRQLSEIMQKLIENRKLIKCVGKEGRKIYDKYFSFKIFEQALSSILQKKFRR